MATNSLWSTARRVVAAAALLMLGATAADAMGGGSMGGGVGVGAGMPGLPYIGGADGDGASQSNAVRVAIDCATCPRDLPAVLAERLGAYKKAGVDVALIRPKSPKTALAALLEGSADVAAGDYGPGVSLTSPSRSLEAFVSYCRLPGVALVVAPKATASITSVADLDGKTLGAGAPGSTSDFVLRFLLAEARIGLEDVPVMGGLDPLRAAAALEDGQVDAAVLEDPGVTRLQMKYPHLRILADTRSERGTQALFGADYPGGALYAPAPWVAAHAKETQALADALVATLGWIREHSAEEIVAKMPEDAIGPDRALYVAAVKNALASYSPNGLVDRQAAATVLGALRRSMPEVADTQADLAKAFTNEFAGRAYAKMDMTHDARHEAR
jgi:NitT/TauT family transport system substrate-binding protein